MHSFDPFWRPKIVKNVTFFDSNNSFFITKCIFIQKCKYARRLSETHEFEGPMVIVWFPDVGKPSEIRVDKNV